MWRQSWQPSLIAATVAGTVNATVASTMAATLSETAAATVSPSTVARAATIASTNDNCHWLQRQLLSDSNIGNSHWWWSRFTKLLALSYNLSPIDSANCTLYQFRNILLDFVSFQHRCTLLHFWNAAGIISHHKLHGVSELKHYSFCANQCKLHTVCCINSGTFYRILLLFQYKCTLLHFWNTAEITNHHKQHGVSELKHYSFCAKTLRQMHTVAILIHGSRPD